MSGQCVPRRHELLTGNLDIKYRLFPYGYWSGKLHSPLKEYRVSSSLLFAYLNWVVRCYCWRHHTPKIWRNQDGTDIEVSSLLASLQGDRRCYTGHWRRKDTNDPTHQGIMPAMIINYLARYHNGMTVIGVTSHLLGGLEAGPQQEILSSTIYRVKNLCLGNL